MLPPFDNITRKVLHTIANKLGLKSKSHGKGNNRYLVITKTSRDYGYNEQLFARCQKFVKKQYLPRTDVGSHPPPQGTSRRGPRATGPNAFSLSITSRNTTISTGFKGVSVRAGDKIGQGAPELHDAKGSAKARAMMEKMGWSAGQGLGKEENKGILNPVEQVVWYSRAGLG
jgi:hypothetical protein